MARTEGSSKAAVAIRREQVWRLALRGYSARQIAEGLRKQGTPVLKRTLERDLEAVRMDLLASKQIGELYSLNAAFVELGELWREAWAMYGRPQPEIVAKDGTVIKLDDRMVKTLILRELKNLVRERARICGFYSQKVMERITMIETAAGRGIQIERIPFEEQLRRGAEELKNNEGLARSEGIIDQAFSEGRPV